jgi:5'(3')-deoxyribonucleotidase
MEKQHIRELIQKKFIFNDIERIKKEYSISYGQYAPIEITQALKDRKPVILKDRIVVGVFPDGLFMDQDENKFKIEKDVEGIIVNEKLIVDEGVGDGDILAIPGRHDFLVDERYATYIEPLRLGPVVLPPHSLIINFVNPTDDQKKKRIVSDLVGANVNVYTQSGDYIGDIFHEFGHVVWRCCLRYEEKQKFNELAQGVRSGAIFEYAWEHKDGEETFCTIYKWYLRSLYVNKSFFNILDHEEPVALGFLRDIFDRLAKEKIISDVWDLTKDDIYEYLNPRLDRTTGRYIRRRGDLDRIKDVEIPQGAMDDIDSIREGTMYVNLMKGLTVPVTGRKVDFSKWQFKGMKKAIGEYRKPIIYLDMDGVVADFVRGYKEQFGRNAYKDDSFTITHQCATNPHFFRTLPVLERGRTLYNDLKDRFQIVFLTTPMDELPSCRADKVAWAREHFPDVETIIFSSNKAEYASHEGSILIDDMDYNLTPWAEAGGTAIDFTALTNDKIKEKINDAVQPKDRVKIVGKTNLTPTEAQKESGNYAKGEVIYRGMKIKVENPAGSIRFGWGEDGLKWVNRMKAHYGYIVNGEDGNDGDKVDCFLKKEATGSKVFVVNQVNPASGLFDEIKAMLGYGNIVEAEREYMAHYSKGWKGFGGIVQTNSKKFREWLDHGKRTEPFTGN